MRFELTIENTVLAATGVAVTAMAAVALISAIASVRLIDTSSRALAVQRISSSLESIRYQALASTVGESDYVITGRQDDAMPHRRAAVMIDAEISYLTDKKHELILLAQEFEPLKAALAELLRAEVQVMDARDDRGFRSAQQMVARGTGDSAAERVQSITYRILAEARGELARLEVAQLDYADRMRRWLLALVSSAALLLVVLYGAVRQLNIAERAAKTRFAYQAMHDALTGLANRPALVDHLDQRLANADMERALGGFAVMLVDLDGFKAVNDQHGHQTGDALLKQVSERMATTLRDTDFLARLGGDEFMVVIPQVSDRETAARVAEKLVARIATPYDLPGMVNGTVAVSASIGISLFPHHGGEREVLMKHADEAMYAAKHAGRNQYAFAPDA